MLDPGPPPDLSSYSVASDDAYEWWLSDHPWAVAARQQRREAHYADELRRAAEIRDWTDRTDSTDLAQRYPRDPAIAKNLERLSQLMRPMADEQQLRSQLESAEPDEIKVVRDRRQLETRKRVEGDENYRYPAHLIGPGAAAYPPPASGFRASREIH